LVILPWTARNYRIHQAFIPISTNGGTMLWMGLHHGANGGYDWPLENNPLRKITDEVARNRVGIRESIKFIINYPREFLNLSFTKMKLFWEGYLFTRSGRQWAVIALLGLGGLAVSLKEWRKWTLLYIYLLTFTGIHLFVHSSYRYRLPLHPLAELWAAYLVVALAGGISNPLKKMVKNNPLLLRLFIRGKFLAGYPKRELFNLRKSRLFFTVEPYTMIPFSRMKNLYNLATRLEEEGRKGSFVECGVWNGGSAAIIASVAKDNPERQIWLFDSWEGLPAPDDCDIQCTGKKGESGMARGAMAAVKKILFEKLKLSLDRIHLAKGWFDKTIPDHRAGIGSIALLHLDCDWYASVKICLEELFSNVVEGGIIVIDDYGEWAGCKKAVDEFLARESQTVEMIPVDYAGVYFLKK